MAMAGTSIPSDVSYSERLLRIGPSSCSWAEDVTTDADLKAIEESMKHGLIEDDSTFYYCELSGGVCTDPGCDPGWQNYNDLPYVMEAIGNPLTGVIQFTLRYLPCKKCGRQTPEHYVSRDAVHAVRVEESGKREVDLNPLGVFRTAIGTATEVMLNMKKHKRLAPYKEWIWATYNLSHAHNLRPAPYFREIGADLKQVVEADAYQSRPSKKRKKILKESGNGEDNDDLQEEAKKNSMLHVRVLLCEVVAVMTQLNLSHIHLSVEVVENVLMHLLRGPMRFNATKEHLTDLLEEYNITLAEIVAYLGHKDPQLDPEVDNPYAHWHDLTDGNIDICATCLKESNKYYDDEPLVPCDSCMHSYHKSCLGITALPRGLWHCPKCRECFDVFKFVMKDVEDHLSKKFSKKHNRVTGEWEITADAILGCQVVGGKAKKIKRIKGVRAMTTTQKPYKPRAIGRPRGPYRTTKRPKLIDGGPSTPHQVNPHRTSKQSPTTPLQGLASCEREDSTPNHHVMQGPGSSTDAFWGLWYPCNEDGQLNVEGRGGGHGHLSGKFANGHESLRGLGNEEPSGGRCQGLGAGKGPMYLRQVQATGTDIDGFEGALRPGQWQRQVFSADCPEEELLIFNSPLSEDNDPFVVPSASPHHDDWLSSLACGLPPPVLQSQPSSLPVAPSLQATNISDTVVRLGPWVNEGAGQEVCPYPGRVVELSKEAVSHQTDNPQADGLELQLAPRRIPSGSCGDDDSSPATHEVPDERPEREEEICSEEVHQTSASEGQELVVVEGVNNAEVASEGVMTLRKVDGTDVGVPCVSEGGLGEEDLQLDIEEGSGQGLEEAHEGPDMQVAQGERQDNSSGPRCEWAAMAALQPDASEVVSGGLMQASQDPAPCRSQQLPQSQGPAVPAGQPAEVQQVSEVAEVTSQAEDGADGVMAAILTDLPSKLPLGTCLDNARQYCPTSPSPFYEDYEEELKDLRPRQYSPVVIRSPQLPPKDLAEDDVDAAVLQMSVVAVDKASCQDGIKGHEQNEQQRSPLSLGTLNKNTRGTSAASPRIPQGAKNDGPGEGEVVQHGAGRLHSKRVIDESPVGSLGYHSVLSCDGYREVMSAMSEEQFMAGRAERARLKAFESRVKKLKRQQDRELSTSDAVSKKQHVLESYQKLRQCLTECNALRSIITAVADLKLKVSFDDVMDEMEGLVGEIEDEGWGDGVEGTLHGDLDSLWCEISTLKKMCEATLMKESKRIQRESRGH